MSKSFKTELDKIEEHEATVLTSIRIPRSLKAKIDKIAKRKKIKSSQVMVMALRSALGEVDD